MREFVSATARLLFCLIFVASAASATMAAGAFPSSAGIPRNDAQEADPSLLEIRLEDGGLLLARLAEETISVKTRYGTLNVPVTEVRRIELARRLPAEAAETIEQSLKLLASNDLSAVASASDTLVQYGEAALPALCVAARNTQNLTLTGRIREVVQQIFVAAGDQPISLRDRDVVETATSQIRGTLVASSLRIQTDQFGILNLKLADARLLRSLSYPETPPDELPVDDREALPDPGSLSQHAAPIGQKMVFRVTGSRGGSVWGTDIYTSDSTLATVAVHAGVLKEGETGLVQVEMVPGQDAYEGTSRNGVVTSSYGNYPASYRVRKPVKKVRFKLFSWQIPPSP